MKKVKWYSLPPLPTLLLVGAAAALLTCTLRADEHNALAYFSYLLSTYALITGMSGLVRLFRAAGTMLRKSRLMRKLHENAHLARYLDDALFRTEINLYFGTAVNALYIFIKFFSGVALRSG